ncbi:PREDICTED: N-acetylglucosaminyl-phosphatidylinositol de-N-acetylase [Ceratosolen solmsi marchali]|uniref:N-acetylglucosaminylphosphatidylinositol deacetylase n=1 Tax=Ceratosolen solmsi marchali TaxID=326594 RepID=A0AAJ7DX25_9HYME|nr:PREDICTED: N-acetylglucosaminyl-phosphatidylinositol de-N-acetylase [Ceratosolen solmsi marchali]
MSGIVNLNLINEYVNIVINDIAYWWSWYMTEISHQFLISIIAYICTCVFLYIILKRVNQQAWQLPGPPSRLLVVTAHPDDEVMFFGPMIYSMSRTYSSQIYLLCLTMGGNKQRKEELWGCAKELGIPEANVTIIMCTDLPDNPKVQWPEEIVATSVLQHIESHKINAVVTFDKHGVSRHKNHISLFYAIASLCIEKKVPSYCKLYALESVNILRKYTQLLDLPISLLTSSYWYLITYQQRHYIRNAMKIHKSQYVWYRKLYMMFSRYTLINTLQEINILDLELDLELEQDD